MKYNLIFFYLNISIMDNKVLKKNNNKNKKDLDNILNKLKNISKLNKKDLNKILNDISKNEEFKKKLNNNDKERYEINHYF